MSVVLVTGASGFIGRELCRQLGPRARAVPRDEAFLPEPSAALVHLAFPVEPEWRHAHPAQAERLALQLTERALACARSAGARHVVLASSAKVFGARGTEAIRDDQEPAPNIPLGMQKLACEAACEAAAGTGSIGVSLLRLFNVYGPGQRAGFLIPTLVDGIRAGSLTLGELDHARDWVHVRDVVAAILVVLGAPPAPGTVRRLNVATGVATSARELCALARSLGHTVPEPQRDVTRARPDEASAERGQPAGLTALGWEPRVSLRDGLAELLD